MVPVFATVAQNKKKGVTALLLNNKIVFFDANGEHIDEMKISENMAVNKNQDGILAMAKKMAKSWIEEFLQ